MDMASFDTINATLALQIVGLVGMATLLYICITLSRHKNIHFLLIAGPDVLRWLALLLGILILSRLSAMAQLLSADVIRAINSIGFIGLVGGIIWSLWRHGRST